VSELIAWAGQVTGATIVDSDQVGTGLVPPTPSRRSCHDLIVAGLPMAIKDEGNDGK
jgi:hypothetical protein